MECFVAAAQEALADRKHAQMYTSFNRPENVNFVRHYLLADGTYKGINVGSVPRADIIGHAAKADNSLQLVKFTREGGKDVVLINWQGHPRGNDPNPYTAATSNYPGVMRTTVEQGLDCQSILILGGSGNMNVGSQIASEEICKTYIEVGQHLGKKTIKAAANFTPAKTGELQILRNDLKISTTTVLLYAFSIGDPAFVTAPFEVFHTNAVAVRESSDFKMTFYTSCSNESHGYMATPETFSYFAYEAQGQQPMGTAENVQEALTQMLAINEDVAKKVLSQTTMQLLLDERNVIVDVVSE